MFRHGSAVRGPVLLAGFLAVAGGCATGTDAEPATDSRYGPKETWMDTQFRHVVAQQEDFSCGAAALATLLQYYYRRDVEESDVLALMDDESGTEAYETESGEEVDVDEVRERDLKEVKVNGFSFAELAGFAAEFGFRGEGYRADFEALRTLKVPVIAHIGTDWYQHFVVVREVTEEYVVYADPSWGNRRMTSGRFGELWGYSEDEPGKGRILAILPDGQNSGVEVADDFFVQ